MSNLSNKCSSNKGEHEHQIKENSDSFSRLASSLQRRALADIEARADESTSASSSVRDLSGHMIMAAYTAACRSRIADSTLFADELGKRLAGEDGCLFEQQLLAATGSDLGGAYQPYKTKMVDDILDQWVTEKGGRQIVILGAGLDTRAFRLRSLRQFDCAVFELDFPEMQVQKRARLADLATTGMDVDSCRRVEIATDLRNGDDWVMQLQSNSAFQKDQKSFFIYENVAVYLDEATNFQILDGITSLTRDAEERKVLACKKSDNQPSFSSFSRIPETRSVFIGDLMHGYMICDHGHKIPFVRRTLDFLKATGVPFLWGPKRLKGSFCRELKNLRWLEREVISIPEMHRTRFMKKYGYKRTKLTRSATLPFPDLLRVALNVFWHYGIVNMIWRMPWNGGSPKYDGDVTQYMFHFER